MNGLPVRKMSEDVHNVNPSIGIEKKEIKLCKCGCGMPAPVAKYTDKRVGHIKGKPVRFINGHYGKIQPTGKKAYRYNGGTRKWSGRIGIHNPNHSRSDSEGYVLRYILIVEKALGKLLPLLAVIHHHNCNSEDDRNKNLVVCENKAYHNFLHQRMRAYNACGHANWRKCYICKQYDAPNNLYILSKGSAYHKKCKSDLQKKQSQQRKILIKKPEEL